MLGDCFVDMEEQYDKIYRFCYFRLRSRQAAEDITQETFLRYFERYQCATSEQTLRCLYTIARNLCVDEYRRDSREAAWAQPYPYPEEEKGEGDEQVLTSLLVRAAVASLEQDEQELLLLRYVNEVPIQSIAQFYGISRFAVYRRLAAVTKRFQAALRKEGFG